MGDMTSANIADDVDDVSSVRGTMEISLPVTTNRGGAGIRDVFLYFSHKPQQTIRRILRFHRELADQCDFCVLTYDEKSEERKTYFYAEGISLRHVIYNRKSTARLGYKNKVTPNFRFKSLNVDLAILLFWRDYPNYNRYWVIEDDVEYTGHIGRLLGELSASRAALLATHIRKLPSNWDFIDRFETGDDDDADLAPKLLSFLPFHAATGDAFQAIDRAYRRGWAGMHEMTWPAILRKAGLEIEDLGGLGAYTRSSNLGKHYIDLSPETYEKLGSFGTRSTRLWPGKQKDTLWHPVKVFPDWVRMRRKRTVSILKWYVSRVLSEVGVGPR